MGRLLQGSLQTFLARNYRLFFRLAATPNARRKTTEVTRTSAQASLCSVLIRHIAFSHRLIRTALRKPCKFLDLYNRRSFCPLFAPRLIPLCYKGRLTRRLPSLLRLRRQPSTISSLPALPSATTTPANTATATTPKRTPSPRCRPSSSSRSTTRSTPLFLILVRQTRPFR